MLQRPAPRLARLSGVESQPAAHLLAALFLLYGLIATALLSRLMPPFQNPDEPTHYLRAAQIADGRLLARRHGFTDAAGSHVIGGGPSDPAVLAAEAPFDDLISKPAARDSAARWQPPVAWSQQRAFLSFPNTAMYPPLFYLPDAAGIGIGRRARMSVVDTLALSRMLNGACAVTIAALAVGLAEAASVWLFAVLCLPMSLSLMASAAQDGLMLAVSALAGCLFVRLARPAPAHPAREMVLLGLALGAIAMARPPYGVLALLPLALGGLPWRLRLLGAAMAAGLGVAWSLLVVGTSMTNVGGFVGADPAAQTAYLLHEPWRIPAIAARTMDISWRALLVSFVGQLGWLNVALPSAYHAAAHWVLALAALATALGGGVRLRPSQRALVLAALAAAACGIFAIQYVTWTVPRNPWVAGLQGRYFLPLALAGVGLLAGLLPQDGRLARLRVGLIAVVAAFPIASLAVTVQAVVDRYYLN